METATKTSMSPDEYIEKRVDDQLSWYDRKSIRNKKLHVRTQGLIIFAGALIPLLVGFTDDWAQMKYLVAFLGVLVTITEGIRGLNKYQEHWKNYRATYDNLLREKLYFLNKIGEDYTNAEYDFKVFVLKCEQIMAGEQNSWLVYAGKKDDKNQNGNGANG